MANGHPTRDEDFDLLALGAVEGDEKQAIEAHVASCADCARKLAEARGRVAMLSLAAPRVEPSAAVKQRLMAQV
ncbi:MAG: zf-HC2 domain-containing protein, partial [Candidatus Acidiferrales bacterium]